VCPLSQGLRLCNYAANHKCVRSATVRAVLNAEIAGKWRHEESDEYWHYNCLFQTSCWNALNSGKYT